MPQYRGHQAIYQRLAELNISFDYLEHPPLPTAEIAMQHRKGLDATHCKNLFFRNHKGNRHYLVIFEHSKEMAVRDLEQMLRQGKLSFASPQRLEKYLNVIAGSVSPLGLIYDTEHHVHVFIDDELQQSERITFHPNDNTATLVFRWPDFMRFIDASENSYELLPIRPSE